MLVKIVTFFLIGMAILALFGRLRMPPLLRTKKCEKCGAPLVGKTPCPCGHLPRR